jgi:hypothetical protein
MSTTTMITILCDSVTSKLLDDMLDITFGEIDGIQVVSAKKVIMPSEYLGHKCYNNIIDKKLLCR